VDHASSAPRQLKVVFWDLYADPEDVNHWSGITAMTLQGLRVAGVQVVTAGHVLPYLRRLISSALWHYYKTVWDLHYIPDRHMAVTKAFSWLGRHKAHKSLAEADAVVTTSTTATAFLKTDKPIFVIHDATWGQIIELYPYFHKARQVPAVVRGGFEMEHQTLTRTNVTLVFTSDWAANQAILDHGLDRKRVHVLPLGANFTDDPPRDRVERAIRARKGEHCNLLFVGREFDRKGGEIAVQATDAVRKLGIAATLHVVGCSPKGLPPWVQIHGLLRKDRKQELSKLHSLYADSDFFILPTQAEAQGIVFNEAAAYGLPVIATEVGGVSSVVHSDWGLLLPKDTAGEHYASWMAELFRDRARYTAMARRARDDYDARLSRTVYTERLTAIIREVLNERELLN